VGTRLRGMRRFCRWLVTEGELEVAPTDGIEIASSPDKAGPDPVRRGDCRPAQDHDMCPDTPRPRQSDGLADRSSRPQTSPRRTAAEVEAAVVALRRERRLGPARIAGILGLNPYSVHRVLTRHGLPRLAWLDRPTGEPVRRYERGRPGELVHVDVKKLGRLREVGGWREHGRDSWQNRRT
jgi:hypothetical protein